MTKTYTLSYELPSEVYDSLLIGAEYFQNQLVQFSVANYNAAEKLATVTFERSPVKGNTLKFFYFNNLENLAPLYLPKEIKLK